MGIQRGSICIHEIGLRQGAAKCMRALHERGERREREFVSLTALGVVGLGLKCEGAPGGSEAISSMNAWAALV